MADDAREQRGLVIAATCNVTFKGGVWSVPSQTEDGRKYTVSASADSPSCSCPDFETRGVRCKHIHAVRFVMQRRNERNRDGSITQTDTLTVTETVETTIEKKTTYRQDWTAYNKAQSGEKDRVQELLFDLCRDLPEPERKCRGQKPHTIRDQVFSMVFKVYSTISSRRFSSDLREARERGFMSKEIPGLKVAQFMENAEHAPLLRNLIAQSALPLRAVETSFAIDSSGFGSSRFETWIDQKYGTTRRQVVWVKVHIACGTKTNVVTAVRILDGAAGDSPQFGPLVKETAEGFTIGEVSADKAYSSYENFETVAGFGGDAFIAFKLGTTAAGGGEFKRMFHYFQFRQTEFLEHYHKRSNVESTFSAIKRKFGPDVRSKTDAAMVNEVYCKILAHNLCVLIQEQHELGIEAVFRKKDDARVLAV